MHQPSLDMASTLRNTSGTGLGDQGRTKAGHRIQGSNLAVGSIANLKLSTAPSSTKLDRGRLMFLSAEPSPSELEAGLRLGEEYVLLSRRPPSPILHSRFTSMDAAHVSLNEKHREIWM